MFLLRKFGDNKLPTNVKVIASEIEREQSRAKGLY